MSFNDTINAYFVTTAATSSSEARNALAEDFAKSLAYLRNHLSEENIRQIKASEGFPLIASGRLTKKDVFIFDCFEGDLFAQLQLTKSLIVGPRCLIECLLKCLPIPLGSSPVYTVAMRDLRISATGITAAEKERLRQLIQWMGGHYFQNFGRPITHLISNTIKSTKYEHATLNGMQVMHVDWVQRVWERSSAEGGVQATDAEFDKYRLPIFFGTNITCTGLDSNKKTEIMRLVNENGGTYHRTFRSQIIDIVITEKSKTNSEKFAAAVRCKKDVLLPEWIVDSVAKGFALPTKAYLVKSLKVSTPTKTDQSIADFTATDRTQLSDISCISVASGEGSRKRSNEMMTTVNDTLCSNLNDTRQQPSPTFAAPGPLASSSKHMQREVLKKSVGASGNASIHYRKIIDDICPKQAKKAGTFLDGCCIYLSGFRTQEREKLNRILNVGGATRYDVVNEKITHIIVGQLDDAEFKAWKRDGLLTAAVNIVRLDWLLESIKLKQPARETVYRMSLPTTHEPDAPSPSSKRTLRSMNHSFSFKQPDLPIKKKLFDQGDGGDGGTSELLQTPVPMATSTEMPPFEEDENNLIAQYSQENEPAAAVPLPPPAATTKTKNRAAQNANDTTIGTAHPMASSTHCDLGPQPPRPVAAAVSAPLSHIPSDMTVGSAVCTIDYDNLDFFQGMAIYIDKDHYPDDFYTQMINECESAQGNVVAGSFRDPVDYAIVSFERTFDEARLPVKVRHIVTELYVEHCLKQNKLIPIEYYHKYIPHTADALPLQGMTVVVSTYTGLERDYIDSLAQLLGAKLNKTFAKKEKPLLVCPLPEGSKYEGAIKWRYPIVTSDWMVQCAQRGEKLSYRSFLVGDSHAEFPISPTLRENNSANRSNVSTTRGAAAPEVTPPMEIDAAENVYLPPPETDFTPLRNKRVSELAGPTVATGRTSRSSIGGGNIVTAATSSAASPDSPHTPPNAGGRHSVNFDFLESLMNELTGSEAERECMRDVIELMRNNPTPELERLRRQACTPIRVPTPKGIPDFCTTPAFQKRMADEFERRFRLPTKHIKPDTPIDVLRRRIMAATCKAQGIPYNGEEEEDGDLAVEVEVKGGTNAATLERNAASSVTATTTPVQHKTLQDSGLLPRSLFASAQTPNTSNASDTFVPCTQTPGLGVVDVIGLGNQSERGSLVGRSTINFDKISFEETEVGTLLSSRQSRGAVNAPTTAASVASPEIKQITDYLRNCESRRQSMKRNEPTTSLSTTAQTEQHAHVQPFESEQFGAGTEDVGWRDPVEFGMERRSKVSAKMQHAGTPRFSISCTDEEVREDVIAKILQLGGEVSENLVNFDPECTHFICERPNRGEKTLGCIASGKWVLSIAYIEECYAKDVFIDEELCEFGNSRALNLPQLSNDEQVIALAAHRWRRELHLKAIQGDAAGAFDGFRAILHTPERNLAALKSVIKAGKGQIIEAEPPFMASSSSGQIASLATHCFVDVKKKPLTGSDYAFLRQNGVQIFTQMYINSFLMHGREVEAEKYEVIM